MASETQVQIPPLPLAYHCRQATSWRLSPFILKMGTIITHSTKEDVFEVSGGKGTVSRAFLDPGQDSGAGRNPKTASSLAHRYSRSWAKASLHKNPNTAFLFFSPNYGSGAMQGAAARAERKMCLDSDFPLNFFWSCYHLLTTDQEQMTASLQPMTWPSEPVSWRHSPR